MNIWAIFAMEKMGVLNCSFQIQPMSHDRACL